MEALTFFAATFFQFSQQDDKLTSHLLIHHSQASQRSCPGLNTNTSWGQEAQYGKRVTSLICEVVGMDKLSQTHTDAQTPTAPPSGPLYLAAA